ncbi:MAG: nucleotide-diphospho-sugar transferase [Bacteroidia bacterium]|nr:MAG: nucleotide-diphospho-sugar transferase [Bacteroidia bacterium]
MFDTPVLFLIFNRPAPTRQVFEQIRKIQPRYLFVAADGPRKEKPDEVELCKQTRDIIKEIDWDCELKTFFRDENAGCARNVSGAISWFFEHVNQGIILEDDCLPDITFFSFCERLLTLYQNDDKVRAISGFNCQLGIPRSTASYYFASIPLVWGWATWKDAWMKFEFNIDKADPNVFNTPSKKLWQKEIELTFQGKIDSWDFRWIYSFFKNDYICIYPNVSLVRNVGVGDSATHTFGERWWYKFIKYGQIRQIKHPAKIQVNEAADELTSRLHMSVKLSWADRIKRIFYRFWVL